jgi:hypothetical protein
MAASYRSRSCNGGENDIPLGLKVTAVPGTNRASGGNVVAGSTVSIVAWVNTPPGTARDTRPAIPVSVPPFGPTVAPSFTETRLVADTPSAVATTTALPVDSAVTKPEEEIVTTVGSELVQLTARCRGLPLASLGVATRDTEPPGTRVTVSGAMAMVATGAGGGGGGGVLTVGSGGWQASAARRASPPRPPLFMNVVMVALTELEGGKAGRRAGS